MWVKGLSIDGFGVFSEREFRDLSPGLTVLYGANEAGKSTLLAFVRSVLFGFPRATKTRRAFYPPLGGGRHGGRVFLHTEAGAITVEREAGRAARILLEPVDGSLAELSDVEFQQLIGGVDAQTFRTVFAFSLDELRDFDSLTGEQVRARIFAAGVGGAGPSVRDVIQRMEKTCGQLLKPRSREGEINRILEEMSSLEHRLAESRSLMESYPDLLRDKASLRERLEMLEAREQRSRSVQTMFERLLELWPAWVDVEAARYELGRLEPVDEFIPDAMRRLTEAKSAVESARSSLERLEEQKARRVDEIRHLRETTVDGLSEIASAVERQVGLIPNYRDRLRDLQVVRSRVTLIEDRLHRLLRDLGPDVDEELLERVDTSLPRIEEARGLRAGLQDAARQTVSAVDHLDSATAQRARAEADRQREQEALEALSRIDPEVLSARVQALRVLRPGVVELQARRAALDGRSGAWLALVDREGESQAIRPPLWSVPAALIIAVLLAVTAALAEVGGRGAGAAAAGVLALVFLVGAIGLVLWRRLVAGGTPKRTREAAEPVAREMEEQDRLRGDIAELESRLAGPATVLGLTDLGDSYALELTDSALAGEQAEMAAWNEQAVVLDRAEQRLEAALVEESLAESKVQRLREDESLAREMFKATMSTWGLSDRLSPEGVEEYLRGLNTAKELSGRRDEERVLLIRLEQEAKEWEQEGSGLVAKALAICGKPADGGEAAGPDEQSSLEQALLSVAERCRADRDVRSRVRDLESGASELEVEIDGARFGLEARVHEWESLLEHAGVCDEERFLERFATYQRRQQLKQTIELGEGMLVKSVGKGRSAEEFRAALSTGEVSLWEAESEKARCELEETRAERAGLIKAEGEIERRLRELESSADVSSTETVLEGLRTELASMLEQWRINQLAAALVRETLARFTLERQPLVLSEASRMFGQMTQGRYLQVRRSTDEEGIVVVDPAGRMKSPEELSRGTAEQLYLCLRLGLAEEFARRAEPIPLVMDDVLVNFDAARRRSSAELLLDFAADHQLLFFTCHEEIVDLIASLRPDTRRIELS